MGAAGFRAAPWTRQSQSRTHTAFCDETSRSAPLDTLPNPHDLTDQVFEVFGKTNTFAENILWYLMQPFGAEIATQGSFEPVAPILEKALAPIN
jgi:hypothetical protein